MKRWNRCFGIGAGLFLNVFLFVMFFAGNAHGDLLKQNKTQQSQPTQALNNPEFIQKTQKLHMPFIANEGQVDERVAFYAKTFGGTVFVTKDGDIVYSLPKFDETAKEDRNCRNGEEGNSYLKEFCNYTFSSNPKESGTVARVACPPQTADHKGSALRFFDDQHVSPSGDGSYQSEMEYLKSDIHNQKCYPSVIASEAKQSPLLNPKSTGVALKEGFIGAKVSEIKGEGESITKVSYFKGNDPSKWKSNISTYELVNLGEIYDGIELKLKAHGNNVEKLLYVKPGADTNQIKISLSGLQPSECKGKQPPESPFIKGDLTKSHLEKGVGGLSVNEDVAPTFMVGKWQGNGARGLSVNEHGELEVETALGTVKFTKPIAYQEIDGKRVEVKTAYVIRDREALSFDGLKNTEIDNGHAQRVQVPDTDNGHASRIYSFTVASYDKTKDLIIDPLLASTYLGGSSGDICYSVDIDPNGNVYITGDTWSSNFPTTVGVYDTSHDGGSDVFISKLNGDLTQLIASTFLGGSSSDWESAFSIKKGLDGNIYIVGCTSSSDFPTTLNAFDRSHNGDKDVFVSKLNGDLTQLLASTFLGGSSGDLCYSGTVDQNGDVYIAGDTWSSNFPTTVGAYDTSHNDGSDVFISKLNGDLTQLIASTFLGGSSSDWETVFSMKKDVDGNIYIVGGTNSPDFPTTLNAFDRSYNGDKDVFVSKLNGDLTQLLASTFLGGSAYDIGRSIAIDSSRNIYVTGWTFSSNFPTTPGVYDNSFGGEWDVFVSKLNRDLTELLASTYLGGSSGDGGYCILVGSGNVYVAGDTSSSNFPTTPGAFNTISNGDWDAFVSKLSMDLTKLVASTYIGGSLYDSIRSMDLGKSGNVCVGGLTYSQNFPTTPDTYSTTINGSNDVFVSNLDRNLSTDTAPPSFYLSFPVHKYKGIIITAYNAPISAVFDHSMIYPPKKDVDGNIINDGIVTAFTGDTGYKNEQDNCDRCYKYSADSNQNFVLKGVNYVGVTNCGSKYLCYDGHNGIDYAFEYGTPLYPAISGTVTLDLLHIPKAHNYISPQSS